MADRLHILPKHREELEVLLREHLPDVEVWAYGSRVNGKSHDGSDLDLVLRAPDLTEIPDEPLTKFGEALRESSIPFLVEAHDWMHLPERFHREIERNYVVLGDASRNAGADWPLKSVEEVSEKVAMGPFGSSIKVSTFVPEGIPVISGQHLHEVRVDDTPGHNFISHDHAQKLRNANVQSGDVVFTHRGTLGQVAYIPQESKFDRYVISQSQFYMRCDLSKVLPEFVANYFRSPEGQHKLLANSSQVGVPSIAQPVTYLRSVEIPVPPLHEQRAIAHILGTLDDKIELNRRMNETLEAMARAIFKDWFVDFGPTRAKMEGRAPYLPPDIWNLFPATLDANNKPLAWIRGEAHDWFEFNPKETIRRNAIAPYLDMAALPTKGAVPRSPIERAYRSGSKFRNGDTLLARITPCLENGKAAFVFSLPVDVVGAGSTEFVVIRSRKPIPAVASYLLARDGAFRAYAERCMTGTSGRQRASSGDLGRFELVLPDSDRVWKALGQCLEPLIDRVIANANEVAGLTLSRDLLLPKLISGAVGVPEHHRTTETSA